MNVSLWKSYYNYFHKNVKNITIVNNNQNVKIFKMAYKKEKNYLSKKVEMEGIFLVNRKVESLKNISLDCFIVSIKFYSGENGLI